MSIEPVVTCYASGYPLAGRQGAAVHGLPSREKGFSVKLCQGLPGCMHPAYCPLTSLPAPMKGQTKYESFLILVRSDVESDLPDCGGSPAVPAFSKLWKTL